jgi:hypothetical protein
MRFMMIIRPPATAYDQPINHEEMAAMGRYNDELRRAGVLREVNGLLPPAEGARVRFAGSKRTVIDGPFSEAKEMIGGYWILEVGSKEEALAWAQRIPLGTEVHPGHETEVEVRRIAEPSDLA